MKKIIQLFIPFILLFSILFTPIQPTISNQQLHFTKNESQAFLGALFKIIVNVAKGTTKSTKVTKKTKFSKNNFVLPPKNPKIRTYKGKKQVQTIYNNGKTEWITIRNYKYKNKTYTNKYGKKIKFDKNGFPKFPHKFQMTLKDSYLKAGRDKHNTEANKSLKESYSKNKTKFKKMFNKKQLKEIENGKTPNGYTWHHHQTRGVMQLVHKSYHEGTSHTGGFAIWARN